MLLILCFAVPHVALKATAELKGPDGWSPGDDGSGPADQTCGISKWKYQHAHPPLGCGLESTRWWPQPEPSSVERYHGFSVPCSHVRNDPTTGAIVIYYEGALDNMYFNGGGYEVEG